MKEAFNIEEIKSDYNRKITPNLIKNWNIENAYDGSIMIVGNIYNDTKGRFVDGTYIHTSRVMNVDFLRGVAITKNSFYNLEPRKIYSNVKRNVEENYDAT